MNFVLALMRSNGKTDFSGLKSFFQGGRWPPGLAGWTSEIRRGAQNDNFGEIEALQEP
jgi:hypothetical protein